MKITAGWNWGPKVHLRSILSISAALNDYGVSSLGKIRKNKDGRPRKRSQHTKGNKLWYVIFWGTKKIELLAKENCLNLEWQSFFHLQGVHSRCTQRSEHLSSCRTMGGPGASKFLFVNTPIFVDGFELT
jgi:hypothetical protein